MRYLILSLLFSLSTLQAQNLVNNPSFELQSNCPDDVPHFSPLNWYVAPNTGTATPDYFHACSVTYNGIPTNPCGNQLPHDGYGHTGIFCYDTPWGTREYIQSQLSSPLVAGQNYLVSFFASLADRSEYAINKLGAALSVNSIGGDGTYQEIAFTPQIVSNGFILDSESWTEVSGIYQAIGGEEYITIGNFSDNANTPTMVLNSAAILGDRSYYYIDMVSVTASTLSNNQDHQLDKFSVYPNPCSNNLSIEVSEKQDIKKIEIYNALGNIVLSVNPKDNIDVSHLSSGLYFLVITNFNKPRLVKKIVKE